MHLLLILYIFYYILLPSLFGYRYLLHFWSTIFVHLEGWEVSVWVHSACHCLFLPGEFLLWCMEGGVSGGACRPGGGFCYCMEWNFLFCLLLEGCCWRRSGMLFCSVHLWNSGGLFWSPQVLCWRIPAGILFFYCSAVFTGRFQCLHFLLEVHLLCLHSFPGGRLLLHLEAHSGPAQEAGGGGTLLCWKAGRLWATSWST